MESFVLEDARLFQHSVAETLTWWIFMGMCAVQQGFSLQSNNAPPSVLTTGVQGA
jgi:hypothetical protein